MTFKRFVEIYKKREAFIATAFTLLPFGFLDHYFNLVKDDGDLTLGLAVLAICGFMGWFVYGFLYKALEAIASQGEKQ